jgi:SAM-dependent methyltransferase
MTEGIKNEKDNLHGQIMKRVFKIDTTLLITFDEDKQYKVLKSLGFNVQHIDLNNGENEFDFEDYSFEKIIAIDVLQRVKPPNMFIEDCIRILRRLGIVLFFFPHKCLTSQLEDYLKTIKCNNNLYAFPSSLKELDNLDYCLIEIKRCPLKNI